ncbi:MAG: primosomal protein DnaI [Planifilum sp.]
MNRINRYTGEWMKRMPGRKGIEARVQKWLSHPSVAQFLRDHPQVSKKTLVRSLARVRQFVQEQENCAKCPGLDRCPNLVQGHAGQLVYSGGYVELSMQPCDKLRVRMEEERRNRLIRSHYIPRDILSATFETIVLDAGRTEAIRAAIRFCNAFADGRPERGLYLYGPFGVGKSRIAGAMTRELVRHNVDSLMVYVPDFMREMRDAIQEGSLQEKLGRLKKATVLILDDIGAETLTPWTRDEVLGSILQYRVSEGLPVVYTSNLDLDELEDHLAHSHRGGTERAKARRIMERIRHYVDVYPVEGPNRRLMKGTEGS